MTDTDADGAMTLLHRVREEGEAPEPYTIVRLFAKNAYLKFEPPCNQSVPGFDGAFVAFRKIDGPNEAGTGALAVAGGGTPRSNKYTT